MRKKYKLGRNNENNKMENKRLDQVKNSHLNSKFNLDAKKESFSKGSRLGLTNSKSKNTIENNTKDSVKIRKFRPFKKDDYKKIENINDISKNNNTLNYKDANKNFHINENKNFRFNKKRKIFTELSSFEHFKFNKNNPSISTKNEERIMNTDPNILEYNKESNIIEKSNNLNIKENNLNIKGNVRRRILYFSTQTYNEEREKGKDKKDNKLNEEKLRRNNILNSLEKVTKRKEIEIKKKISNIPSEIIKMSNENNNKENKIDNHNSSKNESSKILSLIKKCKRRSIHNNNTINSEHFETNDDNNLNITEKEDNSYFISEKRDNFTEIKSTSSTINSRNRIKKTFNFLIHQAHENANLSDTFSKMYESYISHTSKKRKNNISKILGANKCLTLEEKENEKENINNTQKINNSLSINENSSLNSISYLIKEYGNEKLKKRDFKFKPLNIPYIKAKIDQKYLKKGYLRNLLEISPKLDENNNDNNAINEPESKNRETINVTNRIVNNNTFNTTYNIYKINNTISKKDSLPKINEKLYKINEINHRTISSSSASKTKYYKIFINKSDFKKNDKIKKYKINTHQRVDSYMNRPYKQYKEITINQEKIITNAINIEILYLFESKSKAILNKINIYEICFNECHDWVMYYFDNNIYDLFLNLFKNKRNKNNIINKIKIEILCYFLCYDASFSKTFSQAGILLKTIFHLLQNNFLLLLVFILNNFTKANDINDDFNNYLINNLNQIINKDLKINLSLQEIHNENCIIEIFEQNFKQINNYYKMIIDNLYNYSFPQTSSNDSCYDDINNNKIYKFPQCLSLDMDKINNKQKMKIVSLFFFDAYKLLNNYNIMDLKLFYDLFLNKKIKLFDNKQSDIHKIQKYFYHNNRNKKAYYGLLSINIKLNNNSRSILYPIKSYYKYTLMINLDTIVYYNELASIYNINNDKNKKVVLRPGIFQFFQEMKQIYELILFSNNSFEYVSKVLKNFENNEKYFDYILTNNQINFEKDGSIKNLELLGREIKNIIILDKEQSFLKLNKENIIYLKPFYGDINFDENILNNLIEILKKIKYDMEDNDDIRMEIIKYKKEIFTKITTNLI